MIATVILFRFPGRDTTKTSHRIQDEHKQHLNTGDESRRRGMRRNASDHNEVMKLYKRCKPNTVIAKIECSVHILQEYIAEDPESYHP